MLAAARQPFTLFCAMLVAAHKPFAPVIAIVRSIAMSIWTYVRDWLAYDKVTTTGPTPLLKVMPATGQTQPTGHPTGECQTESTGVHLSPHKVGLNLPLAPKIPDSRVLPAEDTVETSQPFGGKTFGTKLSSANVIHQPPRVPSRTTSVRKPVAVPRANHRRCSSSTGVSTTTPLSLKQSSNPIEILASALRCAVIRKEIRSIQALLADRTPEIITMLLVRCPDALGYFVIHTAASTTSAAVVEEVLKHVPVRTDIVNAKGPQGQTPLHIACRKRACEVAQTLLKYGADPNIGTNLATSALHLAAGADDVELCRLLLIHNADPNAVSRVGALPLLAAVHLRNPSMVAVLLEHGANTRQSNKDGLTPRELALRLHADELSSLMDSYPAVGHIPDSLQR